jgi:hypothetical protein
VKRTIDRADRDTQCFRDIFDSGYFPSVFHSFQQSPPSIVTFAEPTRRFTKRQCYRVVGALTIIKNEDNRGYKQA